MPAVGVRTQIRVGWERQAVREVWTADWARVRERSRERRKREGRDVKRLVIVEVGRDREDEGG